MVNNPKPDTRYFGKYYCRRCKRKWSSGYSFANFAQKCVRCKDYIYAFQYSHLKKPNYPYYRSTSQRMHQTELCEGCNIGISCHDNEPDEGSDYYPSEDGDSDYESDEENRYYESQDEKYY